MATFKSKGSVFRNSIDKVLAVRDHTQKVKTAKQILEEAKKSNDEKRILEAEQNLAEYQLKYIVNNLDTSTLNHNNGKIYSNTSHVGKFIPALNNRPVVKSKPVENALKYLTRTEFFDSIVSNDDEAKNPLRPKGMTFQHVNLSNIRTTTPIHTLKESFKNVQRIRSNGTLFEFDTETIGGIRTDNLWKPGGITEFAVTKKDFKDGKNSNTTNINILLNSKNNYEKELKEIEELLDKPYGMERLKANNALHVSAIRLSIYGHDNTKIEFNKELGYAQVTALADTELAQPGNIKMIRKGVEKLTKHMAVVEDNSTIGNDVWGVLESIADMNKTTKAGRGVVAGHNIIDFDNRQLEYFLKQTYHDLNKSYKSTNDQSEKNKITKDLKRIHGLFGNNVPGLEIEDNNYFDFMTLARLVTGTLGNDAIIQDRLDTDGTLLRTKYGNSPNKQEVLAQAFYPKLVEKLGAAHIGITDTNIGASFITENIEGGDMPLVDYLMNMLQEKVPDLYEQKPIELKTNKETGTTGKYFITKPGSTTYKSTKSGKDLLNFSVDTDGRIITKSGYVIDKNAPKDKRVTFDQYNITPGIKENTVYEMLGVKRIDLGEFSPILSANIPQYSSSQAYVLSFKQAHSKEFAGTHKVQTQNMIFSSMQELEAWMGGSMEFYGEDLKNGEFYLDPKQAELELVQKLDKDKKHLHSNRSSHWNKLTDREKHEQILKLKDSREIAAQAHSFVNGDNAVGRVSRLLDFNEYLKNNNLQHLDGNQLTDIYFHGGKNLAHNLSVEQMDIVTKGIDLHFGFTKRGKDNNVTVTKKPYQTTVEKAMYALGDIQEQEEFYKNLIAATYRGELKESNKILKKYNSNIDNGTAKYIPLYHEVYNNHSKSSKRLDSRFKYLHEQALIKASIDRRSVNGHNPTRDEIIKDITGSNEYTNTTKHFKNKYDVKLSNAFVRQNTSMNIQDIYGNDPNILTIDLSKNPRSYIDKLVEMKYGKGDEYKTELHRRAVFYDFIDDIFNSDLPENKALRRNAGFNEMANNILVNSNDLLSFTKAENMNLDEQLKNFANVLNDIKDTSGNKAHGILKANAPKTLRLSKPMVEAVNNMSYDEILKISKGMSSVVDAKGNEQKVKSIARSLSKQYMPTQAEMNKYQKGKSSFDKKIQNMLYQDIQGKLESHFEDILNAADILKYQTSISDDGEIHLFNDTISKKLVNIPRIKMSKEGLYAEVGQNNTKKAIRPSYKINYEGKDPMIYLSSNIDESFGKPMAITNKILNRLTHKDLDINADTLDRYVKFDLDESQKAPLLKFNMGDLQGMNKAIDASALYELLPEVIKDNGKYRYKLDQLREEGKIVMSNESLRKLQRRLPDKLKKGEIDAVSQMMSAADILTIASEFVDDKLTKEAIKNTSTTNKETRVAEGKFEVTDGIRQVGNTTNLLDNTSRPVIGSSLNAYALRRDKLEETQKKYKGLFVAGSKMEQKDVYDMINSTVDFAGDLSYDTTVDFMHRQALIDSYNLNLKMLQKRSEVISNVTSPLLKSNDPEAIYDLIYNQLVGSTFEQAKVFDSELFELTRGSVAQDKMKLATSTDLLSALEGNKNRKTKFNKLIDVVGDITQNEDGTFTYTSKAGTIVRRGEAIVRHGSYGGTFGAWSSKFDRGVLGFDILASNGDVLSDNEVTKILNKKEYRDLINLETQEDRILSLFNILKRADNVSGTYTVENINRAELVKTADSSSEKSMTRLLMAKTGSFNPIVKSVFSNMGLDEYLDNTILTEKAVDAILNDRMKETGEVFNPEQIKLLKSELYKERHMFNQILFGENGIFAGYSGIANDNLVGHKNAGAMLSGSLGEMIMMAGKHLADGADGKDAGAETYERGLNHIVNLINNNEEYNFLKKAAAYNTLAEGSGSKGLVSTEGLTMIIKAATTDPKNTDYLDTESYRSLYKRINDDLLAKKVDDKDLLIHKNIKVLNKKGEYETIEEMWGAIDYYIDNNGNKVFLNARGVVDKRFLNDSEVKSGITKEYIEKKRQLRDYMTQIEQMEKDPTVSIEKIQEFREKAEELRTYTTATEATQKKMKFDDQARNILERDRLDASTVHMLETRNKKSNGTLMKNLAEATTGLIDIDENNNVVIDKNIKDRLGDKSVNHLFIKDLSQRLFYNDMEERLLTEKDIVTSELAHLEGLYNHVVRKKGQKLGYDSARELYGIQQALKAVEFNEHVNHVYKDDLMDFGFQEKKIADYVSTRGQAGNPILNSVIDNAILLDLGEEFGERDRYLAVPGLGVTVGTKEITKPWHEKLEQIKRVHSKYIEEGVLGEDSKYYDRIVELSGELKQSVRDISKKEQVLGRLAKVEANVPTQRLKLLSTINGELLNIKGAEEFIENNNINMSSILSKDFRNKALIEGKSLADWEKQGMYFDYATMSRERFKELGFFDEKTMKTMGIETEEEMVEYLKTHGTMGYVDRYPNIKDTSIRTTRLFLDDNAVDNAANLSAWTTLAINGDSDGDSVSIAAIEHNGINYGMYNANRQQAIQKVKSQLGIKGDGPVTRDVLNNYGINANDFEEQVRKKVITGGVVDDETYSSFRGMELAMAKEAATTNKDIFDTKVLQTAFKNAENNYKSLGLLVDYGDGKKFNALAELEDGKSILGNIKLFAMSKSPTSQVMSFITDNNNELNNMMNQVLKFKDDFGDDYKHIKTMEEILTNKTNISHAGTKQINVLDELLSMAETLSKSTDERHKDFTTERYQAFEQAVLKRVNANNYFEELLSKSTKGAIGNVNATLYAYRQASADYFGNNHYTNPDFLNEESRIIGNKFRNDILQKLGDEIEQGIISGKKEKYLPGEVRFDDIEQIFKKVRNNEDPKAKQEMTEWIDKYLDSGNVTDIYDTLQNNGLITKAQETKVNNIANKLINNNSSLTKNEATDKAKIQFLSETFAETIAYLDNDDTTKDSVAMYKQFSRRGSDVLRTIKTNPSSANSDSFGIQVWDTITESETKYQPKHTFTVSESDTIIKNFNEMKNAAIRDRDKVNVVNHLLTPNSSSHSPISGAALGIGAIGLVTGLMIGGFATGNPLKRPDTSENTPEKIENQTVPEFFDEQGGYVTGNSQQGYIINVRADTNKGQKHMKRSMQEAIAATTGGAVSVNMNFRTDVSNYTHKDIEDLINKYI